MSSESWELDKLLEDIWRGCSLGEDRGGSVYIKHFGFLEQRKIDRLREGIFQSAKKRGLPTNKESLAFLEKEGLWSDKDSQALIEQEDFITKLELTQGNLLLGAQKEQLQGQIDLAKKKYTKLHTQKLSLLKDTCESYATKKINHEMLFYSFYKDPELKEYYLSRDEFENLTNEDIWGLTENYNEATAHLSMENIKKLAIYPGFVNYYNVVEDSPESFFDKKVFYWTFYQVNLINYAKIFKNILQNIPDIPEGVKRDPNLLLDYAQGDSKRREVVEKSSQADGYSLMGATAKDYGNLDLEATGGKTLSTLVREKGGKMEIEDFADLFGK